MRIYFMPQLDLCPAPASSAVGRMKFTDCKLACETNAATILQLALYSELLERLSVRGRFKRQPHIKLCAIRTRAEVDFAVMPFDDDPVADNQAESRA
jgi:hypothetical protein